jgi:hypothetical protein
VSEIKGLLKSHNEDQVKPDSYEKDDYQKKGPKNPALHVLVMIFKF